MPPAPAAKLPSIEERVAQPRSKRASRNARLPKAKRKSLSEYRSKRRFDVTPEPAPRPVPRSSGHSFVIQKHDATRLHYDFRLEVDGVLKSWAVPKGPSLDPSAKRLAMQTEDHPLDYAGFEGMIPEGEYGAGPVIVWDRGTFTPEGAASATEQLERGELKFGLQGEKLHGSFVLVKIRGRDNRGNPWLLIKHRDADADPDWRIEEHEGSVLSGRNLKQVEEKAPEVASPHPPTAPPAGEIEGAREAKMPESLSPMLATLVDKPFSDPDWIFEIKWDGVRSLAFVRNGKVKLRSRNGLDITHQYPEFGELPTRLSARTAILDGEIVALDEKGISNFERLQPRMHVRAPSASLLSRIPATYYFFDLVYCDGQDLRNVPLIERKEKLHAILAPAARMLYADHQPERGAEFLEAARRHGLEGVIGKRAQSRYVEGRSTEWVKFKVTREVDAVVGGYTAPRGSRQYFGALLCGLYENRVLRFIGGIGTGFDTGLQKSIYARLKGLDTAECPFRPVPETRERAYWVRPELVARLRYANWTEERRLRAPVFIALLDDHRPEDARFENETATDTRKAVKKANSSPHAGKRRKTAIAHEAGRVLHPAELEEILTRGSEETLSVRVNRKELNLTNLNKLYFPESGYAKRHLLAYYCKAAGYILPYLKDRPLVLKRYPDGITGASFFQKDAGVSIPEWMETVMVESQEERRAVHYFIADDLAALLYLTNLGCIDHNPWASRRDDLERPDYVFFDLDPSEGTNFNLVIDIARAVNEKLLALGMKAYLKTSGATGFHLYVPLARKYTFDQVRRFAEVIGQAVAAEHPRSVTQERIIAKRPRRTVMIDAYQNAFGRPLAAPYAVRAFPKAPVSTPIAADELKHGLRPDRFNMKTIVHRVKELGDLWRDFWKNRQRLEDALKRAGAV